MKNQNYRGVRQTAKGWIVTWQDTDNQYVPASVITGVTLSDDLVGGWSPAVSIADYIREFARQHRGAGHAHLCGCGVRRIK